MRVTETVTLSDGGAVTVRELTVGEVRAWLAGLATAAEKSIDLVDTGLFEIPLDELTLFVVGDLPAADALTQSEVRLLIDAAKRLNPDFFGLRTRLWAH